LYILLAFYGIESFITEILALAWMTRNYGPKPIATKQPMDRILAKAVQMERHGESLLPFGSADPTHFRQHARGRDVQDSRRELEFLELSGNFDGDPHSEEAVEPRSEHLDFHEKTWIHARRAPTVGEAHSRGDNLPRC